MTKEDLIKIAKAGFPQHVKEFINFENAEIHHMSGVYRLFDKDSPFIFMLPKNEYLSVFIGENRFVQIESGGKAFNHYAAIKKMIGLKLIKYPK